MMMMPQMMPSAVMPQMMPPTQNDDSSSEDDEEKDAKAAARAKKKEQQEADQRRLSSTYKTLGGEKGGLLKAHKLEAIEDVTEAAITTPRCLQLSDCSLDKVIYIMTGMGPTTKLSDIRVTNKADIKLIFRREYGRLNASSRIQDLTQDMSNLDEVAHKYGWEQEWDYVIPEKVAKPNAKASPEVGNAQVPQLLNQLQELQKQLQRQTIMSNGQDQ